MRRLIVIFVLLCAVFISSCSSPDGYFESGLGGYDYALTEIEGMDCVVVKGYEHLGITCNWEDWNK